MHADWFAPLSCSSIGTPARLTLAPAGTATAPENVGSVKDVGGAHCAGGAAKFGSSDEVTLCTVIGTFSVFCTVKTSQRATPGYSRAGEPVQAGDG